MSLSQSRSWWFQTVLYGLFGVWVCSLIAIAYAWAAENSTESDSLRPEVKRKLMDVSPIPVEIGRVPVEGTVRRDIQITNKTDGSLVIERVETTCGCTTASPPADPIPPGKAISISVEVSNTSRSNSGPFEHYMYVAARDPQNGDSEMVVIPVVGVYEKAVQMEDENTPDSAGSGQKLEVTE